jgi:two-component system, NarL family, sensor kinase
VVREIHDTLAQGLTAVALQIEAGLSRLGGTNEARRPLSRALDVARSSLEEARRSLRALTPSSLEKGSLAEALGALSRGFTADTGVRVRTDIAEVGSLPADVETELFRIASEALANVRKHAKAREASLELGIVKRRVRLKVSDTGVGFRPRSARRQGFGLVGIEERARRVGGRATIRSSPGRGTTVLVTMPLPSR